MIIEPLEVPFKIKLSLWTAIKFRIAGIKLRSFPEYNSIAIEAGKSRIVEKSSTRTRITPLSKAVYDVLKDWYEN